MDNSFIDFLFSYWWLVFPLAYFVSSGWSSWLKYRRQKASLEVLKSYAASGNEPPAEVLEALKGGTLADELGVKVDYDENANWRSSAPFLVVLMGGLAAIFAYAGYTGMLGLGEEAYFVAMILGVVGFAFLVAAIFGSGRK